MGNAKEHERTARVEMPFVEALRVIQDARDGEIVVTTMGSAREWPKLSSEALDFHYLPSAMGHAPMIGMGLALAQPERGVICFNGDGCMLMSLGCLVTIANAAPENLTLIVFDNGRYEVTGGQRTAATGGDVNYVSIAVGAGFPTAMHFNTLEDWQRECAAMLEMPGPRFVVLDVASVEDYLLEVPGPMAERMARFRAALGVT